MTYKPLSYFGADANSYNCGATMESDEADGSGRPGIGIVANALMFWSGQNYGDDISIGRAAAVFNMPAEAIAEAVDHHPFLFRNDQLPLSEQFIEQDGE